MPFIHGVQMMGRRSDPASKTPGNCWRGRPCPPLGCRPGPDRSRSDSAAVVGEQYAVGSTWPPSCSLGCRRPVRTGEPAQPPGGPRTAGPLRAGRLGRVTTAAGPHLGNLDQGRSASVRLGLRGRGRGRLGPHPLPARRCVRCRSPTRGYALSDRCAAGHATRQISSDQRKYWSDDRSRLQGDCRSCRSRSTVGVEVKCSLRVQFCAHAGASSSRTCIDLDLTCSLASPHSTKSSPSRGDGWRHSSCEFPASSPSDAPKGWTARPSQPKMHVQPSNHCRPTSGRVGPASRCHAGVSIQSKEDGRGGPWGASLAP
jgi:hypothetical protein